MQQPQAQSLKHIENFVQLLMTRLTIFFPLFCVFSGIQKAVNQNLVDKVIWEGWKKALSC